MAAVTICSDFGAPKNKVSHCFHCFPIYLPCYPEVSLWDPWKQRPDFLGFSIFWMPRAVPCTQSELRMSVCREQGLSKLRHSASVAVCGFSCPKAHGILVPWSGIEPMSLTLEGGLLTTGPPENPYSFQTTWALHLLVDFFISFIIFQPTA